MDAYGCLEPHDFCILLTQHGKMKALLYSYFISLLGAVYYYFFYTK